MQKGRVCATLLFTTQEERKELLMKRKRVGRKFGCWRRGDLTCKAAKPVLDDLRRLNFQASGFGRGSRWEDRSELGGAALERERERERLGDLRATWTTCRGLARRG